LLGAGRGNRTLEAIDNKQVIDSASDEIAQIARIDTLRHNVGTIVF
jgi:hypothetical protein